MKLTIQNIRWINWTFELKDLNVFKWSNWVGKSTVLQIVKELLQGKTSIKEWTAILEMDWQVINMTNWVIFNSPKINIRDLWFLSWKGKQVKWINSTKEDRRKTIFNLLNIEQFEGDIKWLTWELKEAQIKESTLMDELMEKESLWTMEMDKPKEVKLVPGIIWNQSELDRLKESLDSDRFIGEDIPSIHPKPTEVKLTERSVVEGNSKELEKLKAELEAIKTEWLNKKIEIESVELENIQEKCPTCQRDYDNTDQAKIIARTTYDDLISRLTAEKQLIWNKYTSKANEIKAFKLIEDVVTESNVELYEQYRSDLELHNQSISRKTNAESRNIDIQNQLKEINKQINEFKLVTETKWNEVEYEKYQQDLANYNANETVKKSRLQDIESLKTKIQEIPTVDIKSKIKRYREDELEFVKSIEDKLTIGDIKISVFTELKTPNAAWEMFKSDFKILYKWKEYDELSTWYQVICDVVIEKLFMINEWSKLLLIDNAEISTENLDKIIKEELQWITILTTRISNTDLILKYNIV